ncbi:MAG: hypothetical protein K2Z80_15890, partial [Xanthobacteraceae bacterium]|nr:hypothetical protein [Xanthobacteraceae bacterium]
MVDHRPDKIRALLFLNPRSRNGSGRAANDAVRQLEVGGITLGAVAGLVGNEGGVVSEMFNLESSGV